MRKHVMALGRNMADEPLFFPQEETTMADRLIEALEKNADAMAATKRGTDAATSYRGERERLIVDHGDPRAVGWTYLVNADDPNRESIAETISDLAEHRGMADPATPLIYSDEPAEEWLDWMDDNWHALDLEDEVRPEYILIVGDPEQVPLGLQSLLGVSANVGRVAFESIDDLGVYVDKVCRLERANAPTVDRSALFFGTDEGYHDPTYYSLRNMVRPLAEFAGGHGLDITPLEGPNATKANLVWKLSESQPALVYTASHGLGALKQTEGVQRQVNGSIVCQPEGAGQTLFGADDVPTDPDEPFLEGSVFFQFACFGYGTPAESEFASWTPGVPSTYGKVDFLSALPRALLAHPRGPIAYIGHLDLAFLHGFTDQNAPDLLDEWHNRLAPFKYAIDKLLGVQPSALAMSDMNRRYSSTNAVLLNTYSRIARKKMVWNAQKKSRFTEEWIMRGDAQNYLVLGDPAARLRIPE